MEIFVKPSRHRIDPKHPESTDPNYRRAYLKGQDILRRGKMRFENEAQERDYYKEQTKNPQNVPGLPNFFPPLELKSFVSMPQTPREEIERQRLMDFANPSKVIHLACDNCVPISSQWKSVARTGVTPHTIERDFCACNLCGKQKPYRI